MPGPRRPAPSWPASGTAWRPAPGPSSPATPAPGSCRHRLPARALIVPQVSLERSGQRLELLHVHGLGADLAGQADLREQRVDLDLRPAVAPDAVEDAPQVLAAVQEDPSHDEVEPGKVAD